MTAAADKADAQRSSSAFASDKQGVKDLAVLPRARTLAADMVEMATCLRAELPGLRWWWPWGDEVCLPPCRYGWAQPCSPASLAT